MHLHQLKAQEDRDDHGHHIERPRHRPGRDQLQDGKDECRANPQDSDDHQVLIVGDVDTRKRQDPARHHQAGQTSTEHELSKVRAVLGGKRACDESGNDPPLDPGQHTLHQ